jgi:hypothetical protein
MSTFIATISGLTPLLNHRWAEAQETEEATRAVHIERRDPRTEAEKSCYRQADGSIYFPGAAIARMLREAGVSHKQRGSRKSLKYVIPAAVIVLDDQIMLRDANGDPMKDFEVDSRPVTIPATKGRIMRHRPRFNSWGAEISLEIDPQMIDADTVQQLLTEGGTRIGIGDFRPERGGPFGRFAVVQWAELAARKPAKPKLRAA